jgi:hypothetical protein
MGWFLRKSFRVLPGVRINISKSGPRLSVGVPGARASIGMDGKTRIYGGMGPVRYQKAATLGTPANPTSKTSTWVAVLRKLIGGADRGKNEPR